VPRYFFTIRKTDGDYADDSSGTILPDLLAALSHAETMIRALQNADDCQDPNLMMFVADETGKTVLALPLVPGGD
jgi:Domain of unknown function (DUF6894)